MEVRHCQYCECTGDERRWQHVCTPTPPEAPSDTFPSVGETGTRRMAGWEAPVRWSPAVCEPGASHGAEEHYGAKQAAVNGYIELMQVSFRLSVWNLGRW